MLFRRTTRVLSSRYYSRNVSKRIQSIVIPFSAGFSTSTGAMETERVLRGKYPAKAHAQRVTDLIRQKVPNATGVLYLEGRMTKLIEDNDEPEPFRYASLVLASCNWTDFAKAAPILLLHDGLQAFRLLLPLRHGLVSFDPLHPSSRSRKRHVVWAARQRGRGTGNV